MARTRVIVSWSTGKDAAWSMHVLRRSDRVEVVALLATVESAQGRVAMHGTSRSLLEAQARSIGLPLVTVPVPWPCANAEYETAMQEALERARLQFGASHIAFGDLFLEDVRAYREKLVGAAGVEAMFPLWNRPTRELAHEMIAGGLRAIVTCIDPRRLPAECAGAAFDASFLQSLPADVDLCGERGEFHTFVVDGPMFSAPLSPRVGGVSARDGFLFADLLDESPVPEEADSVFDSDGALSRAFLLNRGTCCGNRCRNCPYDWIAVPGRGPRPKGAEIETRRSLRLFLQRPPLETAGISFLAAG